MAGGASIVVDIKAQITGYLELIEKIKLELSKIDPGSVLGKKLGKTFEQASLKIELLSRNAEKRVTSQSLLLSLFDQLHTVNDLMRTLGQGMANVGLNDVLLTASDEARLLGAELKQVKSDMAAKGTSFFDELKKTNPKELLAVFDLLKFDPKNMGIDTFVESFKLATADAKKEVADLKAELLQAEKDLNHVNSMRARRDALAPSLLGTTVAKDAIRNAFGINNNLSMANMVNNREAEINAFIENIRARIEADSSRSDANKANLTASLSDTITKLLEAKTNDLVKAILVDLDKALKSTKGEGIGGSHMGIKGITGEGLSTELVNKLTLNTYLADLAFIDLIREVVTLLNDSSSTGAQGAGALINNLINSLLLPSDISTFSVNMDALVTALKTGLLELNKTKTDFDAGTKLGVLDLTNAALGAAEARVKALDTVANSLAYNNLIQEYNDLKTRLLLVEEKLGLALNSNKASTAGNINTVGKDILLKSELANELAIASLKQYGSVLEDVLARQLMVGKVEGIAQRWFSVYAAVRMVSKAFRQMTLTIKSLDKTITEIAIVTDMSLSDLWKLMPLYTKMARKYGASLEGVYEVSLLYYQQGLEQSDVMSLTELTLKMARISGLDYSEATNYMTNAIRSFKIEMQDALRVVDVYSALAATSASSTSELATAMSKTASSAAAVGSSFEATSAMMAVMIETTRESPENIGSALKSIISRYGELKENKTGIDEEGEEYSLNKVDTALLSVGISIHDAKGEFRDFDDVIMELAESWDTIDTNTLRYIATVMAGNRQQSRFLALVSNGERLAEEMDVAENSEDAATLLMLKTMDSIDYKSQLLLTSLLSLYTSTGVENLFKGILDGANLIVETFTDMPTLFLLPIPALMSLATNFISIANVVMTALKVMRTKFTAQWNVESMNNNALEISNFRNTEQLKTQILQEESLKRNNINKLENATKTRMNAGSRIALGALLAGVGLNLAAGLISDLGTGNRAAKAGLGIAGSALTYGALGFLMSGHPGGAIAGALIGGLMGVWQNISYIWESTADLAKRLKEEAEASAVEYKLKKAVTTNTEKEITNVKKLADALFDSIEAREKYIEAANKLATDIPELVNYYDAEGNAILDLSNAYTVLAEKRKEANDASKESALNSLDAANKAIEEKQETIDKVVTEGISSSIDLKNLKGTAKEKWENVKKTDNFVGWAAAAERGGGKGNDLGGIMLIANLQLLANTPGLNQLYNLMVLDDGTLLRKLIETPEKRDAMFKQWQEELTSITDPASKAAIDFVLYLLQEVSTELTSAFGELNLASALRTAVIHSNAAEYVNNFIADTRVMAEYGPSGNKKDQAKETLEMFKGIENSSEILTNYLTQEFLSGKYGESWEDFTTILLDPDKSPILNIINILNQIPKTILTELNDLLLNKGRYTKLTMLEKLTTLVGNNDLALAIIDTYSNYYDNLIDVDTFKKKLNKQTDATYFRTITDDAIDILPTLSGEEMNTILDMKDRIESMYSSGRITKLDARKFMNVYSDLWGTGDEAILGIISRITDFSAESLEELYTLIDNSDEFTSDELKETFKLSLATLFGFIPLNLNTSLKSYEELMVTTTKDYSKDMSSATKGMDYEAASELAKKLNIDTSTEYFDVREGELFLKNTSLIYDHYFGKEGISTLLTSKMHKYSENLNLHIESLNQLNLKDLDEETLTLELAEEYGVDLVTLKLVVKDFKLSGLDTITEEWISNYFEGTITNAEDLVNTLFKSDDLTRAMESGKLEDIVTAAASGTAKNYIWAITEQLETSLLTGNFKYLLDNSLLSDEFKSKLPELKQTYDDAQSSVIDDMISGLDEGFTYIEGTEFNKELLSNLESKGLAELTPAINGVSNAIITASRDLVLKYLESITDASLIGMTTSELREKIASLRADTYEKSNMGTLLTILDNYDNIDEVAYLNLLDHWTFTDISAIFTRRADGTYKANLSKLVQAYHNGSIQLDDLTQEKMNEVVTKAIDDGMSSITGAADYITKGTTKFLDMADFTKTFNEAIPGINAEIIDLFSYDKDLLGYTLDTTSYRTYLEALKQLLISLGENTEYIDGIIENANKNIINAIDVKSFMEAELKGTKEAPSKAREALIKLLKNANIWESSVIEKSEDWRDYYAAAADAVSLGADKFTAEGAAKALANEAKKWNDNIRTEAANNFIEQIEKGGSGAVMALHALATVLDKELTSEEIGSAYLYQVQQLEEAFDLLEYGIGSIVNGKAVTALESAGYHLTLLGGGNAVIDSIGDISKAYENYYDALKNTNTATVAALNEAKAKVLETLSGRYKEQSAIDALGDAAGMTYTTFAAILSDAGIEMTDNIIKEYTESLGGNKMHIKDFASFARVVKWDYDSEEYTSAFKSYNDSLIERNTLVKDAIKDELSGLEEIKPGDWLNLTLTEKAIKKAGKDNSKEIAKTSKYLLAALQNKDFEAVEHWQAEIEKLLSEDVLSLLNDALLQYGATLSDGILRLSDDANFIGVAQTLQTAINTTGIEIADDVKDMIQNIMDAYSDLIVKGIEGSLTNVEKSDLKKKASDLGINLQDTDFVLGAEGFELSMNKSIALWAQWGRVNNLQLKKIYKTLNQQLKDNNSNYKTSTKMLSHLIDMLSELSDLQKGDVKSNEKRIELLQNEIRLVKEMLMYSLTNEDSSWGFMSNDAVPASIDNAITYFTNWHTLIESVKTWGTLGTTDINQFASALLHVQEIADTTGEAVEFMGVKVGEGGVTYDQFLDLLFNTSVWDEKSKSYVLDNKKLKELLGFDMSLGEKGISDSLISLGLKHVENNAQILKLFSEFTGGLAQVRKTLNDYSQEGNGHAFEDFIKTAYDDFNKAFEYFDYLQFTALLSKNKDAWDQFKQFTDKVTINGKAWDDAMKGGAKDFAVGSDNYKALMGVIKMALSENWDLETDYLAIAEQLSQSGFNGEVTLGDIVITAIDGATIIKKKKNGKDVFIDPDGHEHTTIEGAKDAINRKAVELYLKELGLYSSPQNNTYEITIAGVTLIYTIENGKVVVKKLGEIVAEGDSISEANESLQAGLAKQGDKNAQAMTSEGWQAAISTLYLNAEIYTEGQITSLARAKMQSRGLTTALAIATEYEAAVNRVAKKAGVETINNDFIKNYNDAIQAEMYASTGLKLDVSSWDVNVTGQNELVKEVADLVNMTQTAVDVMNGITLAFTGTSGLQISEVLSSAIAGAFTLKEIPISEIKVSPQLVSVDNGTVEVAEIPTGTGIITNLKVTATTVEADGTISAAEITAELDGKPISVTINKEGAIGDVKEIREAIEALSPLKVSVEIPAPNTDPITQAINKLGTPTVNVRLNPIGGLFGVATGNVGTALAKGTLMGELGPELVVSKGHYFVVGQSGPEMVNLADDAIVFNHLQTKSLLEKGTSSTRGHAITSEHKAVAYATGSIHGGPAKATIEDVNYKYRGAPEWWKQGFDAIKKNINKKTDKDDKALKSFLKELERWYNWLQKIAYLEKEISYQLALRSKYQSDFTRNGADYYHSLVKTLGLLQDQIAIQADLVKELKKFLELRKAELANSPLSTVYTYDEKGQLVYQPGMYENFSKLFGTNDLGIPYYTAEEQYEALKAMGMEEFMKYDSSGQEIDLTKDGWQATAVQAFSDKMEKERDEILKLIDDTLDGETKLLELETNLNEILHEIEDNLIELENKVIKAMEDAAQREIDELSKLKDALQKTNEAFIKGLTDLLDLERKMYESLESEKDLETKRRRLSILQRSGGSAAEISSLLLEIDSSALDLYFTKLQEQIDLLQEASDNQIAKLELLIDLMTESLEYLKEHGLLWHQVYEVMSQNPEDIADFIAKNNSEYWGKSSEELTKQMRNDLFSAEQWNAFVKDGVGNVNNLLTAIANEVVEERKKKLLEEAAAAAAAAAALQNAANSGLNNGASQAPTQSTTLSSNTPKNYTYNGLTYSSYIEAKNARESEVRTLENSAASADKAGLNDTARALRASALAHRAFPIIPHYSAGGMDYTTGLAMLHGTQQKPEAIFNAEQTKILRDNILSSKPDSLISLLKSYNEAYHSLASSTYDSISNNSNSVVIEHAAVNVNVAKLADNYDAVKAGDDIMREMLNIARKTGAQNRVRR